MANWNSINDFLILWPRTKYPRFIFDVWSEIIFDFWFVKYQVIRYSYPGLYSSRFESEIPDIYFLELDKEIYRWEEKKVWIILLNYRGYRSVTAIYIYIYVSRKSIGFPNGRLILIKQPTEVDDIRMIRKSDYVNASIYFPSPSSSYYATSLPRKFKTPKMFRNSAQLSLLPSLPSQNHTSTEQHLKLIRLIIEAVLRRASETQREDFEREKIDGNLPNSLFSISYRFEVKSTRS